MEDVYRSYRKDIDDDQGWQTPVNLGTGVNGSTVDSCPVIFIDDAGDSYLFYVQGQPQPPEIDFKVSVYDAQADTFSQSRTIDISTTHVDAHLDPWRGLIWGDQYPEGYGRGDIWRAERIANENDLTKSWTTPVNMGPDINTEFEETMPSSTEDGARLFFMSDRPGGHGGFDIYEASKEWNRDLMISGLRVDQSRVEE